MAAVCLVRVVNLPHSQPAAAHPNGGHIPALPDDIVQEVAAYLDFNDRLALSLTSRHIHTVVRLRLQDVVVEAYQLAALHKWIFDNPTVRGPQLRTLDFLSPPVSWSLYRHARYGTATQGFLDIISQTSKLEGLSYTSSLWHGMSSHHLQTLTSLRYLHLSGCTGRMLAILKLPITLTQLHLSDTPDGTVIPFRRILLSVCCLPALTTLVLERLSLPDSDIANDDEDYNEDADDINGEHADENSCAEADEGADEHADGENEDHDGQNGAGGEHNVPGPTDALIISSVLTLRTLEQELPPGVSLEATFPNLQTFVLDGSTHLNRDDRRPGTRTLQHLVVSGSFEGEPLGWSVNHLTYIPGAPPGEDSLLLDSACDPVHLVSLTLQLVFVTSLVWHEVTGNAPNIRFLEIESLQTPLPEYLSLLHEQFESDVPIDLLVICLSIVAPASHSQAPEDRKLTRDGFLGRASQYLPALRYVALAESPADESPPDDYAGFGAPWRWWRVVRDNHGSPVEIREIPGWEGERVRRFLRNSDRETVQQFDENFVALH